MPRLPLESIVDPVAAPGERASRLLGIAVPEAPPPSGLIPFYWYFIRQAKALFALLFVLGHGCRDPRRADPDLHRQRHRPADPARTGPPAGRGMAATGRYGRRAAGRAAADDHRAEPRRPAGDQRQRHQPDPLAVAFPRRPPGLGLLPGGFRRPHRHPRHAGRPGAARERGAGRHRRLVHPGLWQHGGDLAGAGGHPACAAGIGLVRSLHPAAALPGATHAGPLEGSVGGAFPADRTHRRQLHQHPDGEAVRPRRG